MNITEVIVNGIDPSAYFLKGYPEWRHVNSGVCFNVFEDIKTQKIFKVQSLNCGSDQIKEISYWTRYCAENQHFNYIPQFNSCNLYKFDKKSVMCIDSEKLTDVSFELATDIKEIFKGYISKAFVDITDHDISIIMNRVYNSTHFLKCIGEDFEDFFIKLLKDLRKIACKQGDTIFSLDFHFNNFMIRPSTGQLVIIDAFSCAMYNE